MGLGDAIREYTVPSGSVALWWLGQAGFVFKSPGGKTVVVDPYLTNSCMEPGAQAGFDVDRLVPPPIEPEELAAFDAYLVTHSHQDHLDPETLSRYREAGGRGLYIAPADACEKLDAWGVPEGERQMTWPNRTHRLGDLEIRTTFAIPFGGDDLTHVGYLFSIEGGPRIYLTGDTAYEEILPLSVAPHKPDVLITVINPCFRNLSPIEAARLARLLDVKVAIPCHYDMFRSNGLSPQMFHTNLKVEGLGDRYRELTHGRPFLFPER